MKANTVELNISHSLLFGKSPAINQINEVDYERNFKNFILPVPMTDQEVAPPLHVWDKISRILDEQDSKKQRLHSSPQRSFSTQTFVNTKSANYNKIGLAFLGAVAIAAITFLLISLF